MYIIWIGLSLLTIPMFLFAAGELAPAEDQGVLFGIVEADATATIDQTTFFTDAEYRVFTNLPETDKTFQLTMPASGFGGAVLKPWGNASAPSPNCAHHSAEVTTIPGIRTLLAAPPALPGGGTFPVEFVIASTAEPETILKFAEIIQQIAATNGMFAFPPIIDTKVDQPETEIVLDRNKVSSLGLDMATVGADLSTLAGGNYVNRFNLAGRSYKVIPQLERVKRLNASQLENTYVKGPEGRLVPLSTFATLKEKNTPRTLNRFQQFNAVTISGVAIRPLNETLTMLEDGGRQNSAQGLQAGLYGGIPPVADRREQVPPGVRAGADADFSRARRPVQQLPRSLDHPAGFRAAGDVWRHDVHLPQDAQSHDPVLDERLDDVVQHLFPGRADHPGGVGVQKRDSDRGIRQRPPTQRQNQAPGRARSRASSGCGRC